MDAPLLDGKKLVIVPILRAGLGLAEGMLDLVPLARMGHVGLYRDPRTLQAVEYYFKIPQDISDRDVLVCDPMLATAHSAIAAVDRLKESGREAHQVHLHPGLGAGRAGLRRGPSRRAGVRGGDRCKTQRSRVYCSRASAMRATVSSGPNSDRERRGETPMSPDLKYLLLSTILCFVQMLVAATGANQAVGLPTLAGNREGLPEITGWAGRAKRAHLNMIENLVLFAALVLIAAVGRQGQRHDGDGRHDLLLGPARLCRHLRGRHRLAAHARRGSCR